MSDTDTAIMTDYELRERALDAKMKELLATNDAEVCARALVDARWDVDDWLDDSFKHVAKGTGTTVTRRQIADAAFKITQDARGLEMNAHPDGPILAEIARNMTMSVIAPSEVRGEMDFKVMKRGKRQSVRVGGFHMEAWIHDGGEFPCKFPVSEVVRVLRELGAKEIKREKRPGRPTGYDGWAW